METKNEHFMDLKISIYNVFNEITSLEIERVKNFLFTHLDEYGDSESAIRKAIEYASKQRTGLGGYVFIAEFEQKIVGAVVVNKTGMEEYIPENILVYIATHNEYRGKGIGKALMEAVIQNCSGDIALHVEASNPARFLYSNLGFENPYLEMRLKR